MMYLFIRLTNSNEPLRPLFVSVFKLLHISHIETSLSASRLDLPWPIIVVNLLTTVVFTQPENTHQRGIFQLSKGILFDVNHLMTKGLDKSRKGIARIQTDCKFSWFSRPIFPNTITLDILLVLEAMNQFNVQDTTWSLSLEENTLEKVCSCLHMFPFCLGRTFYLNYHLTPLWTITCESQGPIV